LSTYYTPPVYAVDGDIAYASDVNNINKAAEIAFDAIETEFQSVEITFGLWVSLAEKWATEAEDIEVEPGKYSAYHWAQKSEDSRILSLSHADAAATSAGLADTWRLASANSATTSALRATDSLNYSVKAGKWAEEAEDVEVEVGKYSAYHWAQKAEDHSASASGSSVSAGLSAVEAEKWATEAEDVEVEPGLYSAYHWAQKAADAANLYVSDAPYDISWDADTTHTASKNALYDILVSLETKVHNDLGGRDALAAHPIASIDGLTTALSGKEPANANIQTHIGTTGNPHGTTLGDVGGQPAIIRMTTATAAATADKAVTLVGYTPAIGDLVALTLTLGNTVAAMNLNINGAGNRSVRMNAINTNTTFATLAAGTVILLYWDGTYWQMMGSQRTSDSNTIDQMQYSGAIQVGEATTRYKLLMLGSDGRYYPMTIGDSASSTTKTVSTATMRLGGPILYYGSTASLAINATSSGVYASISLSTQINYTANQIGGWTAYRPIYLKGTIDANGFFVLDNTTFTSFMTQTLPTSDDGFVYIMLGYAYSTANVRLILEHPIYIYKDGAVRLYPYTSTVGLDADTLDGQHAAAFEPANANIQSHIGSTSNPHGVTAAQAGAAATVHGHVIGDVTNLQTTLDAKFESPYLNTRPQGSPDNIQSLGYGIIANYMNSATGSPHGQTSDVLTLAYNNQWAHQILFPFYNSDMYFRRLDNSTWQAWCKVWHSGNDGAGSGLDADTLDGYQAADILAASGGGLGRTIEGLSIVNSGTNQLTISAGRCYDSTGAVLLEIASSQNLSMASTPNALYHLAVVRDASTQVVSVAAYASEAAIAADGTIDAYRWIDYWRNNGAGAAMAGYSSDGEHWNLKASETIAISNYNITSSYVQQDISAFIPTDRVSAVLYGVRSRSSTLLQVVVFSIDGTNSILSMRGEDTAGLVADWGDSAWRDRADSIAYFIPYIASGPYVSTGGASDSANIDLLIQAVKLRR
jgi:hypothetical protein